MSFGSRATQAKPEALASCSEENNCPRERDAWVCTRAMTSEEKSFFRASGNDSGATGPDWTSWLKPLRS